MDYFKAILGGIAAVIITEFLTIWWVLRPIQSKATGLAVIIAILRGSLIQPIPWILGASLFAILFAASRLHNTGLRVVLFWIPALTATCMGLTYASFIAYVVVRFRNA